MRAKYFSTRKAVFSELSDLSEGGTGANTLARAANHFLVLLGACLIAGCRRGTQCDAAWVDQ